MREIKFRAWDTDKQKWCEYFALTPEGSVIFEGQIYQTRFIVVFYTGLKDKNGKEIFEGDIIPLSNGEITKNATVVFYSGMFCISGKDPMYGERMYSALWEFLDDGEYEVIGNIWENGDLLK